jgi:hypothetical protein
MLVLGVGRQGSPIVGGAPWPAGSDPGRMSAHRVLAGAASVLVVVLILGAASACGDDDDDGGQAAGTTTTGGDELCRAVDELERDADSLGDVDVAGEGTDAVEARLDAIREDLAQVREAAPDTAPDEADAFDEALRSLDDAVTALGNDGLSGQSAQDLVTAVASTVDTGQAYVAALDEACP